MKIVCVACETGAPEIPEEEYPSHMATVHQGKAQIDLVKQNKEILPIGVDPSSLPTPEFMELAKEIDSKPPTTEALPLKPQSAPTPNDRPIQLIYQYTGTHNGHPVQTLELDVNGKHFVVAYDSVERVQIESRDVANLVKLPPPNETPVLSTDSKQVPEESNSSALGGKEQELKEAKPKK